MSMDEGANAEHSRISVKRKEEIVRNLTDAIALMELCRLGNLFDFRDSLESLVVIRDKVDASSWVNFQPRR